VTTALVAIALVAAGWTVLLYNGLIKLQQRAR